MPKHFLVARHLDAPETAPICYKGEIPYREQADQIRIMERQIDRAERFPGSAIWRYKFAIIEIADDGKTVTPICYTTVIDGIPFCSTSRIVISEATQRVPTSPVVQPRRFDPIPNYQPATLPGFGKLDGEESTNAIDTKGKKA